MHIKSRRCALMFALLAVVGVYGSACWRVELLRNQPTASSSCPEQHCVLHTASLSAVR